jgi:hypothetical protein
MDMRADNLPILAQMSMPITTGGPNIGQLAGIERRDRHSPAGPGTQTA